MDEELAEMLRGSKLFIKNLKEKVPSDAGARSYVIAAMCISDALIDTVEELLQEEDKDGSNG